ncbi:MAG: pyridoxal 5'-phosphate synthase lyase subunit PdxS, partial [Thermoplasmatales archaeon]|nr:pyridoxal 5'-phosphate synthase lyase subunit PdxS [Thermoplasmatales archaeon]
IEAIRHQRMLNNMIRFLKIMDENEIYDLARKYSDSYLDAIKILTGEKIKDETLLFDEYNYRIVLKEISKILNEIKQIQKLPVVNFAAGGIATPSDAAIMMQLGSDGVFVGSGIFKSENPEKRARAIVQAVTHYDKPEIIADISKNIGDAMVGIEIDNIPKEQRLQERGW